jgi:hypothetical protein
LSPTTRSRAAAPVVEDFTRQGFVVEGFTVTEEVPSRGAAWLIVVGLIVVAL